MFYYFKIFEYCDNSFLLLQVQVQNKFSIVLVLEQRFKNYCRKYVIRKNHLKRRSFIVVDNTNNVDNTKNIITKICLIKHDFISFK